MDDNLLIENLKAIDETIAQLRKKGLVLKIENNLHDYLSCKVVFSDDKKNNIKKLANKSKYFFHKVLFLVRRDNYYFPSKGIKISLGYLFNGLKTNAESFRVSKNESKSAFWFWVNKIGFAK